MTASTTTTARAADTFPVAGAASKGILQFSIGSHTFAATDDEAGDVFKLCKVPAGATVIGGYVQGKDIDTGIETFDADIGWLANGTESLDADGFGNLGVWTGDAIADLKPEVGVYFPLGGVLFTTGPQYFTNETTITLTVVAAAATLAAAKITVVVYWAYL
jgi:hypothetical protein